MITEKLDYSVHGFSGYTNYANVTKHGFKTFKAAMNYVNEIKSFCQHGCILYTFVRCYNGDFPFISEKNIYRW